VDDLVSEQSGESVRRGVPPVYYGKGRLVGVMNLY